MRLVTRDQWGARPARSETFLGRPNRFFVHYSAADADEQDNHANCAARVRGIQRYHMDHNGWNDIAYSFLFCKHGYVFEGRGWHLRTAATGPCNNDSLAFCFLGNDNVGRDDVTPEGRRALVDLSMEFRRRFGVMVARGHRDCMSTSCPGDELYNFTRNVLPGINAQLPGPVPKPEWWWTWADWHRRGRPSPRPAGLPRLIPVWAWAALVQFNRQHPPIR